jgi:hypothetical protein
MMAVPSAPTAPDGAQGSEARGKSEGGACRSDAHRETGPVTTWRFPTMNGDLRQRAWTRGSVTE